MAVNIGTTLTATPGTWSNDPVVTANWQRDGVNISGATQTSYLVVAADEGTDLTYRETAVNAAGTAYASSNVIEVVASAVSLPTITTNPSLTYSLPVVIGSVLTAVPGVYVDYTDVTGYWTSNGAWRAGEGNGTHTVTSMDIGADLQYVEIVTNADGSIEAFSAVVRPTATQTPTSGVLQSFVMESQPSAVSVTRNSAYATYRNSDRYIVQAPANTPRYHHDKDGNFLGLLLEGQRHNSASHSRAVGTMPPWTTVGTGVTVTPWTASIAPDGTYTAMRLQVTAGTINRGIVRGIAVPQWFHIRNTMYASNLGTGVKTFVMRHPANGYTNVTCEYTWTRIDLLGANEGGTYFNMNVLTADTEALDILIWGCDVTAGGDLNDTLILTGPEHVTGVTRPAETLSLTTNLTGNKDVVVDNGSSSRQVFRNVALSGNVLNLSASSLQSTYIKKIELHAANTVTMPTAPAPTPVPSGSTMTLGNLTMIGDSLFKGDPATPFYAPAERLKALLEGGGHSVTFTGADNKYAWPGNIPVCAQGGRTYAGAQTDIPNVVIADPDTVIVHLGTNNFGSADANIASKVTSYLGALYTALGPSVRYILCDPVKLSWLDSTTYELASTTLQAWVSADTSKRFYIDLQSAGIDISGADGVGDGTHWSETGANKIAAYIYNQMQAKIGGGTAAPPPPPPPAPSPTGTVWTSAMVERAIVTATGLNEGVIVNVNPNLGGWQSGSALAMGNRWNCAAPMPSSWSWPVGNGPASEYWPYVYPWGAVYLVSGNTGTGWIEFRNFEMQVLYRGASTWTRVINKTNTIGWGELYLPDMITSSEIPITKRVGAGGGTAVQCPNPTGNAPHFTIGGAGTKVSNPENIEGVIMTCEFRKEPGTESGNLQALLQVNVDPKRTTGGNSSDGVSWYPGTAVSAGIKATSEWQRVTSAPIEGIRCDSTQTNRTMTKARFRSVPPLL